MSTVSTCISTENPIEREFLDQYLEGHPYTDDTFRHYYDYHRRQHPGKYFSLNTEFAELLRRHSQTVTNEEFRNIFSRFTFLHIKDDGLLYLQDHSGELTGTWTFSRGESREVLGHVRDDGHIYRPSGELVARQVSRFKSFHDYTVGCMFAGIWNELICQMPEPYRRSSQHYYFYIPFESIADRYQTHYVTMIIYEKVPEVSKPIEVSTPVKVLQPTEEHEMCYVCFQRPPTTTVWPCGHHVVCRECSHRLRRTNDHHTCIQCRRHIEQIIEDPLSV